MNPKICASLLVCAVLGSSSVAQTISDAGFEQFQVGAGQFQYRPAGWGWTSGGSAPALAANFSAFTSSNPPAPEGTQVAVLQGTGSISQSVTFAQGGNYVVTVQAAQRVYSTGGGQDFVVSLDGAPGTHIKPSSTTYQTYYAFFPNVTAGAHVLSFAGLNTSGGDNTVFLDAVTLNGAMTIESIVQIDDAWVGSSGKTVGFHFSGPSGLPLPTQTIIQPTIYVNGKALGPVGPSADLDGNEVLLFPLPCDVTVAPGDVVTATSPPVWQATTGGLAPQLTGRTLDNRVGRSPLPPSAMAPKTFTPGVNNNLWPTSRWGNYWPFRNWAFRLNWPPGDVNSIKGVGTLGVYTNAGNNGVDTTGYPGPAGLWLVYWKSSKGPNGEAPATFSLTTLDASSTTVTERIDLANPAAPDGYQGRVYDFQRTASSTTANVDVALQFNDPSNTGNYQDLWVVGPGDFDAMTAQPVTLDTSYPFALSRTYTQWIPPGVGSLRWVDSSNCGGNPVSCAYPELLRTQADKGWGELAGQSAWIGFTSLGSVDPKATPWMYSPFYRQPSEQFTATLSDPITSTPAVGTNETYTFSDAATAPLMAGLEVTVDSEIMRILTVSGSSVKLYRGSNGTKPAPHQPGIVKVSGRRPIAVDANGLMGGCYTYQLTTNGPHNLFTGSFGINTQGAGWPNVAWSDGSTTGRLDARMPMVTGPNTLTMYLGTGKSLKPTQTYQLDPAQCYSHVLYGMYIPPDVTALTTAKFPMAALHVNINLDACDDFVWHYMRLIRNNFPSGREVIVEYMNEPWNWAFTGFEYETIAAGWIGSENPYTLSYYCRRACEVGNIARSVWKEAGRDPSEIKLMLNCQLGSSQPKDHLTYAARNGWQVDRIGVAPYLNIDTGKTAFATWCDDQLCDLWPVFLWYDTRKSGWAYNAWMASARSAISDYNKAMGGNCQLMGYEGGIEMAVPAGSADQVTRGIDLVYNPNWYWMEDTYYRWLQRQGFIKLHVYSLSQYHSPQLWGLFHWPRQRPGYGDGRFGGQDNRLRLARPGQPNTKPANVNVDLNESVRGQAFIDWAR